jgi:hypothetical protein
MPSRLLSLVIILCWLGMGTWLFVRDIWPKLRPGEPPAYTWMPSDEAPSRNNSPPIRWNIFHQGIHAYDLEARINYHEKGDDPADDDTFEMQAIIKVKQQPGHKAPLRRLRGFTRVSREGELRAVNAQLHMVLKEKLELLLDIEGMVQDGQLLPRWRVKVYAADGDSEERVFDRQRPLDTTPQYQFETPFVPLEFAERGIVLNPLHPPNRLDTLRPGQRWSMPLVGSLLVLDAASHVLDALAQDPRLDQVPDLVYGLVGRALDKVALLESHVLPQPQPLPPSPDPDVARPSEPPLCWVIEARDNDDAVHARLWIQQSEGERKGLVLRQETTFQTERGDDAWVVQRE